MFAGMGGPQWVIVKGSSAMLRARLIAAVNKCW